MLRITMLGSGGSRGVPVLGNRWGKCDPKNPKNRRRRVSVLVEEDNKRLLIDTSPDLIQQMNDAGVSHVDAIVLTHAHHDHIGGFADTIDFNYNQDTDTYTPLPVYSDVKTWVTVEKRAGFVFNYMGHNGKPRHVPLIKNVFVPGEEFLAGGIKVRTFLQEHFPEQGVDSLGVRVGDFAYSTDLEGLDDKAMEALKGVKVWIVDCQDETYKFSGHANLAIVKNWVAQVKPELTILTHMRESVDYDDLKARLPDGIVPGYDGLVVEV